MKLIQILGPGCPKCEKLKKNAEEAAKLAFKGFEKDGSNLEGAISYEHAGLCFAPAADEVTSLTELLEREETRWQTILATVFDERTTIGMVRLYAKEAADKLQKIFSEIGTPSGVLYPVSPPQTPSPLKSAIGLIDTPHMSLLPTPPGWGPNQSWK